MEVFRRKRTSVRPDKGQKDTLRSVSFFWSSDGARTRYLHLGKVALYQMSYTRNDKAYYSRKFVAVKHKMKKLRMISFRPVGGGGGGAGNLRPLLAVRRLPAGGTAWVSHW